MMRQLFGLDVMRATALLSVLLCHIGQLAPTPPWPGVLQLLGSEGIQLFFVLSGFLIGGRLLSSPAPGFDARTVCRFWQQRARRIVPLYAVTTIVLMLLSGQYFWQYAVFLQLLDPEALKLHCVTWTLCIEVWFYASMPALTWLLARRWPAGRSILFAALLLLLLPWTMITVYSGLLYLSGPAVGVLLAWTQRHRPRAWRALVGTPASGYGSQILLLSVGLFLLGTEHGAWLVLPLQLLQSACCLARLHGLATPTAPLVASPVRWLSKLTYAIYLTHLPILMAGAVLVGQRPGLYLPVILLLALPVILLLSAALHSFIEQPIILLGRRSAEAVVSRPAPGGVAGAGLYPAP